MKRADLGLFVRRARRLWETEPITGCVRALSPSSLVLTFFPCRCPLSAPAVDAFFSLSLPVISFAFFYYFISRVAPSFAFSLSYALPLNKLFPVPSGSRLPRFHLALPCTNASLIFCPSISHSRSSKHPKHVLVVLPPTSPAFDDPVRPSLTAKRVLREVVKPYTVGQYAESFSVGHY